MCFNIIAEISVVHILIAIYYLLFSHNYFILYIIQDLVIDLLIFIWLSCEIHLLLIISYLSSI